MEPWVSDLSLVSRLFLALLLHFVWQASLIVVLVAVGRSLIHPRFFHVRYLFALAGLLAVIAAPLATAGYYWTTPAALAGLHPPLTNQVMNAGGMAVEPVAAGGFFENQFRLIFQWFDAYRSVWLGCWLAGIGLLWARLCISLRHCLRIRRQRKPLPRHLQKLADELKKKLNITRDVVIASSHEVTQAVATGIIKPVVLVPAAWISQLPYTAVEAVLAHELAHIKRWDLWINLLQRLVETLFFFHPLVWWLSRVITREREVCCDQLAIRATERPMRYVETLAHLAGTPALDQLDFHFGTAFNGDKKMNLLRRAKMILEPQSVRNFSPLRTLLAIGCVGLLIGCGSLVYGNTFEHSPIVQDEEKDDPEVLGNRFTIFRIEDGGMGAEFKVVGVIEDKNSARIRGSLIKLVDQNQAGKLDNQQLARELRRLANQLELRENQTEEKRNSYQLRRKDGNKWVPAEGEIRLKVQERDKPLYQLIMPQKERRLRLRSPKSDPNEFQQKENDYMLVEIETDPNVRIIEKVDRETNPVLESNVDIEVDRSSRIIEKIDREINRPQRRHVEIEEDVAPPANRYIDRLTVKTEPRYLVEVEPQTVDLNGGHLDRLTIKTEPSYLVEVQPQTVELHKGHPQRKIRAHDDNLDKAIRELKNEVQRLKDEVNELRSRNKKKSNDQSENDFYLERRVKLKDASTPPVIARLRQLAAEGDQWVETKKGSFIYKEKAPGEQKK